MASIEVTLLVLRLIGFVLGGGFLYYTFRAYRKHRARSMLVLMIAIAMWMAATVTEGFAITGLGLSIDHAHILESIVMIVASAFLLASVFAHQVTDWEDMDEGEEGQP